VFQKDFNLDEWLDKLLNYLAATDQPFEEVECPEFRELLQYRYFLPLLINSTAQDDDEG
jgi:hypothetical protein